MAGTLLAPLGCDDGSDSSDPIEMEGGGGKADNNREGFTDALELLADVEDDDQYEALFQASRVDEKATISQVLQLLDEAGVDAVEIKGEGVPLVDGISSLRLGGAVSELARLFWSGKVFRFDRDADDNLEASLRNAIIGTNIIKAKVTIESLADAMKGRGEDPPRNGELPTFGFGAEPVGVDQNLSVILNYDGTEIGIFDSLIDEIRPVSPEALELAGIDVPEDTDVSNLWIGRATARFGLFKKRREFALYFALDFDLDSVKPVDED